MGIRKNQKIVLPENTRGFRLMTDQEYEETFNRIKARFNGAPMIDCAGETIIIDRIQREDIGGQTVKVLNGRAKWDLGWLYPEPKGLVKVETEDGRTFLIYRPVL
tara:strand:+ start:478 stop:792 length:315 start_codon:yes stop_codon:yes gene_type:complete